MNLPKNWLSKLSPHQQAVFDAVKAGKRIVIEQGRRPDRSLEWAQTIGVAVAGNVVVVSLHDAETIAKQLRGYGFDAVASGNEISGVCPIGPYKFTVVNPVDSK